jgi:hypothetical protein
VVGSPAGLLPFIRGAASSVRRGDNRGVSGLAVGTPVRQDAEQRKRLSRFPGRAGPSSAVNGNGQAEERAKGTLRFAPALGVVERGGCGRGVVQAPFNPRSFSTAWPRERGLSLFHLDFNLRDPATCLYEAG